MQVTESLPGAAWCEGMGERRLISTLLIGDQPKGTWLLTFMDSAREVMSEERARQVTDAVSAVHRVMQGDSDIEHLFADLIDREPPRPASMPAATQNNTKRNRS